MAAVAMSSGVALKQGVSLAQSEFRGNALRQQQPGAAASRVQNVSFAVRAAGYTDELIATAVRFQCLCWCWCRWLIARCGVSPVGMVVSGADVCRCVASLGVGQCVA